MSIEFQIPIHAFNFFLKRFTSRLNNLTKSDCVKIK